MATNSPNSVPVSIHPELAAIAPCGDKQPQVEAARRFALREKIAAEGVTRPIYVWPHDGQRYVLEGIEIFNVASDLALIAGSDYPIIEIELADLFAAKKWRYERVVRTQKDVPIWKRCFQAFDIFEDDLTEYRKQARENQRKGGKQLSIGEEDKKDALAFLAERACVSRSTMARMKTLYKEYHRDPSAEKLKDRQLVAADTLESILDEIERHEKSVKNGAEDVKNEREREIRTNKNKRGAKQPSADFVCDADFDPSKSSQIICGDSLELMERWAALPLDQRPQPSLIFGSPPYYIADRKDAKKDDGKGRINYGEYFRAMMEQRGIQTFEDYVEKFLRPYIVAAYKLLPKGGRLVFQVDNTRGRDANGNLRVYFHTHKIVQIGEEVGYIASSEIVWRKLEISGRKQGFGSRNSPSIRPNHEYILVLRKDCNAIEGDFDSLASAMNEMAISSWDEKPIEEWTDREKAIYTSDIWDIGAARSNDHPAAFPRQLADWVIRLFAPRDTVVLDPWNGSGTTSAMAILNRRNFVGIDIEPYYCEVATKRAAAAAKKLPKITADALERLRRKAA
jgi:DNA modification methylase